MKKLGKYLWNMVAFLISIGLMMGVIYGVRELKLYLDPREEVVPINIEKEKEEPTMEDADKGSTSEETGNTAEKASNAVEEIEETGETVEIVFTGDVLFPDYFLNAYDKEGIAGIIAKESLDVLQKADITMINQEFPFSTVGEAMADKEYTFRIAPSRVKILNELGVDIVTLANNHALDYGNEALLETISILDEADITYVGAGENLEKAKELKTLEASGLTVGILGASRVIPVAGWNATSDSPGMFTTYDPSTLVGEITKAKEICDVVVVYVHWGIERNNRPEAYQRDLAMQYIDAGADMVVGSHPHVMQGIEYYEGKPIIYSLGNFIFNSSTKESGILRVEVRESGEMNLSLVPCTMKNSIMEIMNPEESKDFFEYLSSISYDVTLDEEGRITNTEE